jgi:hypothetical protein
MPLSPRTTPLVTCLLVFLLSGCGTGPATELQPGIDGPAIAARVVPNFPDG